MNWIIFTDDTNFFAHTKSVLQKNDKDNLVISKNLSDKSDCIDELKSAAAVIVYSSGTSLSQEQLLHFSAVSGFLGFDNIPFITDIKQVVDSALSKTVVFVSDDKDTEKYICDNYESLSKSAKERIAKNKLLARGIPFTTDCFATYIAKNKIEVFNEFLDAGMGVNVRDDLGTPMLNIACRNDNFEFVEILLDLGADVNAVSEDRGYTPVMDAIWRGNEKITKYLISKGADLNTINKEGQTNLILAVGADRFNLVKILAENGADPDIKDGMGMSAYSYATLFKKEKIAEVLKPYHKE